MRLASRPAVLTAALLLAGAALPASPALPAQRASQEVGAQRPPVFGATVSRVRVDVIVSDGEGRFVDDLEPGDFRLFEDGQRMEILGVQLVDLEAGAVDTLSGADRARRPPPGEPPSRGDAVMGRGGAGVGGRGAPPGAGRGGAFPPATPTDDPTEPLPAPPVGETAAELGAMIFLIDGPSLTAETKARFADAWNRLLAGTESTTVPRSVYLVDNAGRLEEIVPLTFDVGAIRAAGERVRELPLTTTRRTDDLIELARDLADDDLGGIALAKARNFDNQERSRSLAAYELLTAFTDALWTRSGRTALVWVSSGVKLMSNGPHMALIAAAQGGGTAAEGAPGTRDASWGVFSPDPRIREAQQRLHRAANSSNVSIYSVDPELLATTRTIASDARIQQGGSGTPLGSDLLQASLDGLRDSLRNAAEATGGRAFIHATDIGAALEEIEDDTSRFYLVTYAPPPPHGDGEYHEIRVEVDRDDVDVRARGGYIDRPEVERMTRLISAALALPGSIADLPVEARTWISWADGRPTVLFAASVEADQVGLTVDESGEQRASLDVHGTVLRGDEVVHEIHQGLYARRGAPREETAGATGAGGPDDPVGFLVYRGEASLEPGSYEVRLAMVDNVTGRIGAAQFPLEVPAVPQSWAVGEPMLVAVEPTGTVQPVVAGRSIAGHALSAFVEVYGGSRPILSGQVFRTTEDADGPPAQRARLFPLPFERVATGVFRGSLQLPPSLPPGGYTLQLVVTDPPAEEHEIRRLEFEIVDPTQR